MSRANDERLQLHFEGAERARMCLIPCSGSERIALLRRAKQGSVVIPYPGIFARRDVWEALNPIDRHVWMARSLHALHPDWVFAAYTAAAVYGLDISYTLLDRINIAVAPSGYTSESEHLRRVIVPQDEGRVRVVDGIPVTRLLQTLLDCACMAPFPEGLALVDSALRDCGLFDQSVLHFFDIEGRRRRGIAKARFIMEHMSGKSENGGESKARGVIIEEGFMVPELQVELADLVEPWRTFRVDMLWRLDENTAVAGELDGLEKTENPDMLGGETANEAMRAEREREAHLTARGIRVMRFTPEMVNDRKAFVNLLEAYGIPRVRKPISW